MPPLAPTNLLANHLDAFRSASRAARWDAMSACDGFTVHDVVAHVVAAADETAGLLEASVAGVALPATREFAVRERPYREMSEVELADAMDEVFDRMLSVFEEVLAADPEAVVLSAGVPMPVAGMVTHKLSELALHRWDIVGDDDTSDGLLSQPELTAHATLLGHLLLQQGPSLFARTGTKFEARIRAAGVGDIVVTVDAGGARLALSEEVDGPAVRTDAATRLLLLWGRRPPGRARVTSDLEFETRARLFGLLRGF